MANIIFPSPGPYTFTPWTDQNGKLWIADAKGRWSDYVTPPVVVDAVTDGDLSAVTSNAVFDGLALKAPLATPSFTGNVSASGQFIGAGTGLTGTAEGLTAGNVTTINGRITAGANVTISGAGTAASPYSIAATGGATTWAALTDKANAPLPTDNTPLANALAGKAPLASPAFTGDVSSTGATTANSGGAKVYFGGLPGSESTYSGIWLSQAGANSSNYSFLASSSETFINAPTGGDLYFRVGNADYAKVNAAAGFQIFSAFGVTGTAAFGIVNIANNLGVAGNTTLAGITESPVAMGVVGATPALLINAGTMLTATLTASALSAFSMPTLAVGKSFTLYLKQAATTGMGTATFGATKWAGGAAPIITPTAGRMDILTFSCPDGVNWYGSYTQNFTP